MKRLLLHASALLVAGTALAASAQDVVPVVSAKSALTALASGDLADIFLGKTSRFPDGTAAMPIDLAEDAPGRERFYAQYTGKSPAQVKAHWAKIIFTGRGQPPRQVTTPAEAKKLIADNPNAIGYIDASLVDASVRVIAAR